MNPTRLLTALLSFAALGFAEPVKVATFDVDATPPLGSAMAYDTVKRLDDLTLRCRGVVITGSGDPIVLCAVDWIGIANEGHDAFRIALAKAAGTTPPASPFMRSTSTTHQAVTSRRRNSSRSSASRGTPVLKETSNASSSLAPPKASPVPCRRPAKPRTGAGAKPSLRKSRASGASSVPTVR